MQFVNNKPRLERIEQSQDGYEPRFQTPTCFPNDNSRRIDYVIAYKNSSSPKKQNKNNEMRNIFFEQLREENIYVDFIEYKQDKETQVYALLHASLDRLLIEAEKIKLQMRLNNAVITSDKKEEKAKLNIPKIELLEKGFKYFGLKRKENTDAAGAIIYADFELSNKFLFEAFDENYNKEIFSNTTRSLLVDHILKNLTYNQSTILNNIGTSKFTNKKGIVNQFKMHKTLERYNKFAGLAYMLDEGYFDDAFILHERTNQPWSIENVSQEDHKFVEKKNRSQFLKDINKTDNVDFEIRMKLHLKWAKLTNYFKRQPISLIRSYFGEAFTFYFAWIGYLIFFLILPTIIGVVFFVFGAIWAIQNKQNQLQSSTGNTTTQVSISTVQYTFANSFDNYLTPYFAFIIVVWGILFTETWVRENSRLAFRWNVTSFENEEPDLPEYTRRTNETQKRLENKPNFVKFLWKYEQDFKKAISFIILLIMIGIVAMQVIAGVLYRIFINVKFYPNNPYIQTFIGDVGSSVLNSVFTSFMNIVYDFMAKKLTKWENHRTHTQYEDSLVNKLFAFQFVNNYASLFYVAFLRNVYFPNGLFGLGPEYQDSCSNNNCMSLLSIQVFVYLIITPLTSFLLTVVWPLVLMTRKRLLVKRNTAKVAPLNDDAPKTNSEVNIFNTEEDKTSKRIVSINAAIEQKKAKSDKVTLDGYTQSVIMYGFVLLFACSFSLGPLIVLLVLAFNLRVDGLRLLWVFRRPVGYKAQDIGAWLNLLRIINLVGSLSNACIIAFTSNYSKTILGDKLENRLIFIVIFEHSVFLIWFLLKFLLPEMPASLEDEIRLDKEFVKSTFSSARLFNKNSNEQESTNNDKSSSEDLITKFKSSVTLTQDDLYVLNQLDEMEETRKNRILQNLKEEILMTKNFERHSTLTQSDDSYAIPVLPSSTDFDPNSY